MSSTPTSSAARWSASSPSRRSRSPGFPREPLDEAAAIVETLLREAGAAEIRSVDVPGEAPSILADFPGPGPTVLLYAHYDVQPAPAEGWATDPFTPTLKDGRVYGRGAADDKSGIVAHLAALRAWGGKPPVHVKVLIEGSEENGRQNLLSVVDSDPELMRADVMVIADNGNWKVGEPTLSLSLRGHGKLTVTLRTLKGALHSGHFGGAAPDALLALTPPDRQPPRRRGQPRGRRARGRPLGRRRLAGGRLPPPGRGARRRLAGRLRHAWRIVSGRATRSRSSASTPRRSTARATS